MNDQNTLKEIPFLVENGVSQSFPFLFKTVIWHMATYDISFLPSETQNSIQLKMS